MAKLIFTFLPNLNKKITRFCGMLGATAPHPVIKGYPEPQALLGGGGFLTATR